MTRPWLLRHKLILGLMLVVGSVVLLLGGALLGLSSYFRTMDTTQHKIDEMQIVVQLRDQIHKLGEVRPHDPSRTDVQGDVNHLKAELLTARGILATYKDQLNQTTRLKLDPEGGVDEMALVYRIETSFDKLEEAVTKATYAGVSPEGNKRLVHQEPVAKVLTELNQHSTDLFHYLISDVRSSFDGSRANHRRSLTVTGFATGLACILVLTLLHYSRVWVFRPIKELQAGVMRVQSGNFDQPINLQSRDELEELANEFNAMTARLRDIYKDLARQVNDRTRQLVRSERMVSVGFLAAGVAHEINNPLASIAFCSESLERRLQELMAKFPKSDAEVIQRYLKMIQQEAFRCKQITNKLLDFSRSGGKREPVELSGLIADVLEVAQHLPNARGKKFVFQPTKTITALVSGPDMKSVVLNLVVNALDSMEENGSLSVFLEDQTDFAEMRFVDTGCGMSRDVLENIFEPFFTRNRTGNGTGLGLSISHQIVDQHGGTIQATSDGPGLGCTFVVRIPVAAVENLDIRPDVRKSDEVPTLLPFRAVA